MTEPNEADDGWADLYREFGMESNLSAAKPADPPGSADPAPAEEDGEELVPFGVAEVEAEDEGVEYVAAEVEHGESEADEEADAGEDEDEAGVSGESDDDSDPDGTGPKKRRRRRRRRRKKGAGDGPDDSTPVAVADESERRGGPEEEMSAPESGRELIATWNVPSWEAIVAGLNRPER